MKRIGTLLLLLLLSSFFLMAQGQQVPHKCLTDQLSQRLQSQYPEGVPGRIEPQSKTLHKGEPEFLYVIPVVFHIMHDNGPELGVDLAQLQSQIDVMNEDFGRYGFGYNTHLDGLDTKIKFCLATKDPDGANFDGMDLIEFSGTVDHNPFLEGADSAMKSLAVWDPYRYLNIYIVRQIYGGGTSGYSYFPDEAAGTIYDGLVIDYHFLGRGTGTAIALGRTCSHEAGHFMSLYHPWGIIDTICGASFGDGCSDTPEVSAQFFSIAPSCFAPPSCDGGTRQIENYMDYSDDVCLNMFTNCQGERMRLALLRYRYELVSSNNLAATGCSSVLNSVVTEGEFIIFPVPADEVLMVYADFEDDEPVDIEIYDHLGKMVVQKLGAGQGRGAVPVDVSGLAQGTYHLVIRMSNRYLRKTIFVGH